MTVISQPSPSQDAVHTAVRDFVLEVLPQGVECIQSQDNRVPSPMVDNFVIMTPIYRKRLALNTNVYRDASFTGSITGNVLTVTAVAFGVLESAQEVFGVDVAANTVINTQLTGTGGGVGTYSLIGTAQTLLSRKLASGQQYFLAPTEISMQLDLHGPKGGDYAQVLTTLLRDDWGYQKLSGALGEIKPLYTADPRQVPFVTGEMQYEDRWVLDVLLQVNERVVVSQQFADELHVTLIEVDALSIP